jgi:hypothetical protein
VSVQPITLEVLRVGSDDNEQVVDIGRMANVGPPAGSRFLLVPEGMRRHKVVSFTSAWKQRWRAAR